LEESLMNQTKQKCKVLLIKDEGEQSESVVRAISEDELDAEIAVVPGSEEALALIGQSKSNLPTFALLSSAGCTWEVLETLDKLKASNHFEGVPFVLLGPSLSDEQVEEYYRHGANSFVELPSSGSALKERLHGVIQYWSKLNISRFKAQ
jgi:response regulator RpfG family c-di-GMP phosphodiesterase